MSSGDITQAKRLVIKVGSALLVDEATGRLNETWLATLTEDIARMVARGQEIIVVSSGAIALGRHALKLPRGELRLEESQAAAASGQITLANIWAGALGKHELAAAQVLLTPGDTEQRRRYLNARATLTTLIKFNAIPIINENDTVATSEIRYGDNDRLAARVAVMIGADCLVLLSTVDGFYSADPGEDPTARRFDIIDIVTPQLEDMAADTGSDLSRGGMKTKLEAAHMALESGCRMVIAPGDTSAPLQAIEAGGPCTWFHTPHSPVTARKAWISGSLAPLGVLEIDEGALRALGAGKSLLPAGVKSVTGIFDRGDAVRVVTGQNQEVARGLCAWSSADAAQIAGCKSNEIKAILGYGGREEMIHRDDLVLKKQGKP
ncbi:MAG: glutamate 5-kinase [Parvularculales bacterium]